MRVHGRGQAIGRRSVSNRNSSTAEAYSGRSNVSGDIGIRMPLGAECGAILGMIFRQGFVLTIAGIMGGMAGALALSRVMASLLFGIAASDATTFSLVAVLLGGVALATSYAPAQRATRVDPMVAVVRQNSIRAKVQGNLLSLHWFRLESVYRRSRLVLRRQEIRPLRLSSPGQKE